MKAPLIENAWNKIKDAFDPKNVQAPPTDAENVDALNEGAGRLTEAAGDQKGAGPDAARRLAAALLALAKASPAERAKAEQAYILPLREDSAAMRESLQARPITLETLPPELVRDWMTSDGRARVSIAPKGNPSDNAAMRRFASAVLAVEPSATEGPITILEAGRTVVGAFVEAAILALLSIAVLLWVVLRRFSDVLLTLVPLLMAAVVTLEICSLIGMPLNFANIIAFPLLLGVGVAFKIYYIMAWREGTTHLLQTPLTRAVIFSALTTATAFGSLVFSSHPGTSSMGKLLALSLLTTLAAAALFQPILMGKPRTPAARFHGLRRPQRRRTRHGVPQSPTGPGVCLRSFARDSRYGDAGATGRLPSGRAQVLLQACAGIPDRAYQDCLEMNRDKISAKCQRALAGQRP